jgi:hypothetical protein
VAGSWLLAAWPHVYLAVAGRQNLRANFDFVWGEATGGLNWQSPKLEHARTRHSIEMETTNLEACPQTAPLQLCSIRQEMSFLQLSIHFQNHKEDHPQIVASKNQK